MPTVMTKVSLMSTSEIVTMMKALIVMMREMMMKMEQKNHDENGGIDKSEKMKHILT